ncbi:hypothetical protein F5Y15DRAFT_419710 [Xylariaceae sp. FL0016]|nr:hypothetical protein F5Y15DRAFT_419710 [Xylariaceae sp. FL0016]
MAMYEVRSCEKGRGLFATQGIKRGTTIISEKPILYFSDDETKRKVLPAVIAERYFTLPDEQKGKFDSLYYSENELQPQKFTQLPEHIVDMKPVAAKDRRGGDERAMFFAKMTEIFQSNCCDMEINKIPHTGVFATYSFLNHSCVPNCGWNYSDKHGVMKVQALKDIKKGEELEISYLDSLLSYGDRMKLIARSWRFKCHCVACYGIQRWIHENRRRKIRILLNLVTEMRGGVPEYPDKPEPEDNIAKPKNAFEALELAKQSIQLCKETGLVGSELAGQYYACADLCLLTGDKEERDEWAKLACEQQAIAHGDDEDFRRALKM